MQFTDEWVAQRGFSWKAAYALVSACRLSYEPTAESRRVLGQVWRVQGRVFRAGSTEGLLAMGPRSAVIAFRGTQGLADWMSNLQIPPAHSAAFGAAVHSGFLAAYATVAHLVDRAVQEAGGRTLWFTGHSLGGAIAVIAAAHHRARHPAGVVTFGQPRMLSDGAAGFMTSAFGSSYVRVVNDDDVVARIPIIYRHSGRLLHFDFAGALESEGAGPDGRGVAAEVAAENDGPARVSPEEEAAIERTARAVDAAVPGGELEFDGLEGRVARGADVAIEGVIPGVPAHRIDAYVQLMRVRALATEAEDDTFDDGAGALLRPRDDDTEGGLESSFEMGFEADDAESGDAAPPPQTPRASPRSARQPVVIRLRSEAWVPPAGMPVSSRFGQFATGRASAADIDALRRDPMVGAIEVSREAGIEELDESVRFVGAADIHRPPIDERGDQAIVGLIDTGVDILHQAFRRPDGSTRLLALWDQRGSGGATPAAQDAAFTQDHGRLYLGAEIDALIAAHEAGRQEVPERLRDLAGHGTHVAGIAAGRAVGGMADGMAPEAAILCVVAAITQRPDEPPSVGYSMSHVDALAFLRRAAQGGTAVLAPPLPIAINVSLGMNAGAHDGSTTLEAAFDAITGGGRDPDCVIVKSAGNERGHAGHAKVSVADGLLADLSWTSSSRFREADYFEAWIDGMDDVAFRLIAPSGEASVFTSFDAPETEVTLGGNLCRLHLKELHPDNGAHRLVISILAQPEAIQSGAWRLEMHGRRMVSAAREVHIWVERTQERPIRFDTQDPEMTLSVPGTARTVIAVGACNSEVPSRLNDSSSWGLTRDGRRKPELCAPGFQIRSAQAGGSDLQAVVAKSGTSMAAPHVTGAIALVMSRRRKLGLAPLNAVQFQTALIRTVRGSPLHHHVGAGYGVLDARALFEDLTT
ncbi:S8 family serine peptidase [Salipiger mangrovisoli]|uniref:S8 family serine peptidase n=1 Tax=Salipiger mangrovisoli TaxID=2865933 RepID=A0ABR9X3N7_9RHOB|nr:S8 family serine peptidase [Salipiger mangrovisoli]MBE9638203.1 S8 family serine peptidase [Salipiger mangrovisoli]